MNKTFNFFPYQNYLQYCIILIFVIFIVMINCRWDLVWLYNGIEKELIKRNWNWNWNYYFHPKGIGIGIGPKGIGIGIELKKRNWPQPWLWHRFVYPSVWHHNRVSIAIIWPSHAKYLTKLKNSDSNCTTNILVHLYPWSNAKNTLYIPCLFTASNRHYLERCDDSCNRFKHHTP